MDQHLKRKRLQRLLLLQLLRKVRLLKPLSNDNESYGHFLIFQIMILPGLLEDPSEELAKRHHAANVTIFQKDKKKLYVLYPVFFLYLNNFCVDVLQLSCYYTCMFITNLKNVYHHLEFVFCYASIIPRKN